VELLNRNGCGINAKRRMDEKVVIEMKMQVKKEKRENILMKGKARTKKIERKRRDLPIRHH